MVFELRAWSAKKSLFCLEVRLGRARCAKLFCGQLLRWVNCSIIVWAFLVISWFGLKTDSKIANIHTFELKNYDRQIGVYQQVECFDRRSPIMYNLFLQLLKACALSFKWSVCITVDHLVFTSKVNLLKWMQITEEIASIASNDRCPRTGLSLSP